MKTSVARFQDDYDELSSLLQRSADSLRRGDEAHQPSGRWIARRGGRVTAIVTARERPDRRTFLSLAGSFDHESQPLLRAAIDDLDRELHAIAHEKDRDKVELLRSVEFETEHVFEEFRIEFADVLRKLRRAGVPGEFRLISANQADVDALLDLDNAIRQDVPGTSGWHGKRSWIVDELSSASFDPSAYLVAIHKRTEAYAGLIRVWRNAEGPRLGLVGTLPPYRKTTLASALLRCALENAATWGSASFTTEASLSNQVIYKRMSGVGAESLGRFAQLRRPRGEDIPASRTEDKPSRSAGPRRKHL